MHFAILRRISALLYFGTPICHVTSRCERAECCHQSNVRATHVFPFNAPVAERHIATANRAMDYRLDVSDLQSLDFSFVCAPSLHGTMHHPVAKTCRLWLPLERLRRQTRQDLSAPLRGSGKDGGWARSRWNKAKAVAKKTLCAAPGWTELSSFWSGIHLNRDRCASSTFRTAGPALPRTQRGGCRRKGQAQPAGSELPHLMSGGVAPGM